MNRDQGPGAEQLAHDARLLGLQSGGERAGWLQVREVDDGAVDRHEDDVEGAVAAGHPPPVAVEDGVTQMEKPLPAGLHHP